MFFWNSLAFSMTQQMFAVWSVSSAFSKSRFNIWKFSVHILSKPSLKDFVYFLANVWNECNLADLTFFGFAFLWDWNKNWPFYSCGHCWVFHICWHIECSIFTATSFRMWSSSAAIPSPPLALFIVMLPKVKVKVKPLSCVRLFVTCGLQLTMLLHPWDFPGKSTGVGCHFLL